MDSRPMKARAADSYAIAFAAVAYIIIRRGAGEPAGLGASLLFAARQFVPITGLLIANTLLVLPGTCLVTPAILTSAGVVGTLAGTLIVDLWALYMTLAGAMIPAIVVVTGYGDMPLRTSWRLFHRNLGAASGRLLISRGSVSCPR